MIFNYFPELYRMNELSANAWIQVKSLNAAWWVILWPVAEDILRCKDSVIKMRMCLKYSIGSNGLTKNTTQQNNKITFKYCMA